MKEAPRSVCIYAGTPKIANREQRHCMIVVEVISGQGKAKGNREYSSTIVSIYRFRVLDGSGPLKSRLSLSNGCVAFIKVPGVGL